MEGGGGLKKPSMVGVWIFSGTARLHLHLLLNRKGGIWGRLTCRRWVSFKLLEYNIIIRILAARNTHLLIKVPLWSKCWYSFLCTIWLSYSMPFNTSQYRKLYTISIENCMKHKSKIFVMLHAIFYTYCYYYFSPRYFWAFDITFSNSQPSLRKQGQVVAAIKSRGKSPQK